MSEKDFFLSQTMMGQVPLSARPCQSLQQRAIQNKEACVPLLKKTEISRSSESLKKNLSSRRSRRSYSLETLSLEELSYLIWASQGLRFESSGAIWRTAPSAGGCHPVQLLIAPFRVEGLSSLVYYYHPFDHTLYPYLQIGNSEDSFAEACLGQGFISEAATLFVWVVDIEQAVSRYGKRGYRYMFIDAGHICQNLYLAVEDLGLATCAIGAFDDDEINSLLELDPSWYWTIYLAPVGRR